MKFLHITIAISALAVFAKDTLAQSEGISVPQAAKAGAPGGSTYSCDPNTCKLANNCLCASKNPPNGFSKEDTPQFVTITFDDSIQPQLYKTAQKMLNVTNPNGCPGRGTWFVSMQYTDFSLVQQWYSTGNEIADHTFSHVGSPSDQEIISCREMLNTYGGVPNGKIQGFRAPFLNYTKETLSQLSKLGFSYDSSVSALEDDSYWPYTLDNGLANDCWTGVCGAGQTKIPGLWEIPMYAVLDNTNAAQLMDVYIAGQPKDFEEWSMNTFNKHYQGGRQPFGIYVHPTHLTGYPGLPDPAPKLDGLVSMIKKLSDMPDVWFVTNQQLLQWMKNPVKASELGKQDYMRCEQPVIAKEICNGLDDDNNQNADEGLLNSCNFGTTTFNTCFNCPNTAPTLNMPTPPTAAQNGSAGFRHALPSNCDTKWWDPIANTCLCTTNECQYKDTAVPRAVNGSGVVANGAGTSDAAATLATVPWERLLLVAAFIVTLIH